MSRRSPFLLLVLPAFIWTSCQNESDRVDSSEPLGKKVYATNCKLCHGANGQLGLNGASNLATSELTQEQAVDIITNGRNMMQPFESLLTQEEIEAVSQYILTLRSIP